MKAYRETVEKNTDSYIFLKKTWRLSNERQ